MPRGKLNLPLGMFLFSVWFNLFDPRTKTIEIVIRRGFGWPRAYRLKD